MSHESPRLYRRNGKVKTNTVYFDQNIWSMLTNLWQQDSQQFKSTYQSLIANNTFNYVYSIINVKETLKRDIIEHIGNELAIISDICNNQLLKETGEIILCSPVSLIPEIEQGNYIQDRLSAAIPNSAINDTKDLVALKIVQNNIPPHKAVNEVLNSAFSKLSMLRGPIDFGEFDDVTKKLSAEIKNLYLERGASLGDEKSAEIYFKELEAVLEEVIFNSKKLATQAMNSKSGEEFLETILLANPNIAWKNSAITGILDALQYWPDSPRLMTKKGVNTDMEDAGHAKYGALCDYFISNDKHLRIRMEASRAKLKLGTAVLSFEQFISQVNK